MARRKRREPPSSLDALPKEVMAALDRRLQDNTISFVRNSEWLHEQGYCISKSAIGRYFKRTNEAAQQVAAALERTQAVLQIAEQFPDMDYNKANEIMLTEKIFERLSTADAEDFTEMPMEKIGRLVTSLAHDAVAKRKIELDSKTKIDLAFSDIHEEFKTVLQRNPKLNDELTSILTRVKAEISKEDG